MKKYLGIGIDLTESTVFRLKAFDTVREAEKWVKDDSKKELDVQQRLAREEQEETVQMFLDEKINGEIILSNEYGEWLASWCIRELEL